jgi:antitoxin component YwqK of YwqJK toxin-antitoxin module
MTKIRTKVEFIEKNGRTLSHRTDTYENGQIASIGVFGCGQNSWAWDVPVGIIKSFYEDGILKSEEHFDDFGCQEGEAKFYDFKGRLTMTVYFENGLRIKEVREEIDPLKDDPFQKS